MKKRSSILSLVIVLSLLLSAFTPAFAQEPVRPAGPVPVAAEDAAESAQLESLRVPEALRNVQLAGQVQRDRSQRPQRLDTSAKVAPSLRAADGRQLVRAIVALNLPSLAQAGTNMSGPERAAYAAKVAAAQNEVVAQIEAMGGQVLVRFKTLSSGLGAMIPANKIMDVANLDRVAHLGAVNDYQLDLSETVPFIGASVLQDLDITGWGVDVAVLDSGVDYTHLAFAGPGTVEAYDAAYFGDNCPTFNEPTCANAQAPDPNLVGWYAPKVKGGWDWVGESWPNGPIAPDSNPIDAPEGPAPFDGGHGTHVSDIIAGYGYDATEDHPALGPGVAPDANLWVFKVCSSVSTSCEGIALLAAMDDAANLDDDPQTWDPADVVNMSLGSDYGQPEDDLTWFSNQAADYGMIVVASAGNGGDKPFIVGSPSSGDGVISVAQTEVPSAKRYPLNYATASVDGEIDDGVWQNWSVPLEVSGPVSGTLVYGNANGSNKDGCAPYEADLTGKVALADRGGCNFTLKAVNATLAGASLSVIGLVAPGDPFEGGDGGQRPIDIPSFMISQADAVLLKSLLADGVVVSADPDNFIAMANNVVGSSSRGSRNHDNRIKPDIGAPGASVSAITATGADIGPFGGTSGAAPMVSGVAALMKEVWGDTLIPQQYKALLMNTANNRIFLDGAPEAGGGGTLAPITRIGGGQVDALHAYKNRIVAWDSTETEDPLKWTGSMSFGYAPASDVTVMTRILTIKNFGPLGQNIYLWADFRFADDVDMGVTVEPLISAAFLPAGAAIDVPVVVTIDPSKVKEWLVDRGALGADGTLFTDQEYDGYIVIQPQASVQPITVPWHVLPKAVAETTVAAGVAGMPGSSALANLSPLVDGVSESFSLIADDPNDYDYIVGDCASGEMLPGCNFSLVDIKEVGVRSQPIAGDQILQFAVTVWDWPFYAGQYPPYFDIYIDNNLDGEDDYVIYNGDLTGAPDGRNAVFVYNFATGVSRPYFFTDSSFNSQNYILSVPGSAIGVAPNQKFRFATYAGDDYFTGLYTDCAPKDFDFCLSSDYTGGLPRFQLDSPLGDYAVPADGFTPFAWNSTAFGDMASPDQIGLLFLHRNAPVGEESDALILADPVYPAAGMSLSVSPNPVFAGTQVNVTAVVTDEFGALADVQVFFAPSKFTMHASLSGANEVPFPVETGATGNATFMVDIATGAVDYELDFTGITTPTMAHIHTGAAGQNGGVVKWLYDATGANAPATIPAVGSFTLTQDQIARMVQEGLYVNVHSADYPTGEIRGQITGAASAFTNGDGKATVQYTNPNPGDVRMYAFAGNLVRTVLIRFVAPVVLSVTASPYAILADGVTSSDITAVVQDPAGNAITGATVDFGTSLGNLSTGSSTTDDNGAAITKLAGTSVGRASVTATINGVAGQVEVEFLATPKLFLPIIGR